MEGDLKGYIRDLNRRGVDGLPDRETEQLKDYLEFLTWKAKEKKSSPEQRKKIRLRNALLKQWKNRPMSRMRTSNHFYK